MPVVNNRPVATTIPTPPPATPTTAPAAATATTAAPAATTTTTAPPAGGTVPANGGNVVNARKVSVAGLGTVQNQATATTNRFAQEDFGAYTATGAGPVGRGFIRVDATAIPGGCRINVKSFHGQPNDSITLYLLAEVLDKKTNQLRTITLSVLANGENLNGATYRGDHNFDDINAFLKAKNPNLSITPGHTSLAVSARWSIGHQAGGFGRGGVFRLPQAQQAQSPIATRIAATTAAAGTDDADLSLDMQVAFPAALVAQVPQLKKDGNILTRLESELKGGTDKASMVAAVDTMYRLAAQAHAGDKSEISKLLGRDWTVETVNRYWLKDDGTTTEGKAGAGFFKGFRVDDNGLPIQDPMKDTYMDDPNLRMTRHEGAIRLRSNAAATVVNVKPGGGRTDDKTAITQRIEVGIEMAGGTDVTRASQALQSLGQGTYASTIFNHAQKQVQVLDPTLRLSQCLVPWLDVLQDRHKFTLKNEKTGVEIELSLDFVKATTTRPGHADSKGGPRTVEFCVLEAELDHLQVGGSQNQGTFASQATGSGGFTTDAQQEQWLTATSDQVTMDIDPRLHELKDLDNASFRSTTSYKAFEGVSKKLVPMLFPRGLERGRQKAAAAAEMLGFVMFDDAKLVAAAQRVISDGGLAWTAGAKATLEDALKDTQRRLPIELALSAGTAATNVVAFAQSISPLFQIEYDVPAVKRRVEDKLTQLGLKADLTFLDQLTAAKVPPQNFDSLMGQMTQQQDANALAYLARALGVASPAITVDMQALLQRPEQQAALKNAMATGAIDPSQKGEIEQLFVDLGAKGLTSYEARQQIATLYQNPQQRLDQLAQARGLKAPVIRADAAMIAARLDQGFKTNHLLRNADVDAFVKTVCAARTYSEALLFETMVGQNPEVALSAEAKRLGVPAPKPDRDWPLIDTTLKAQLTPVSVSWTPALEKLVRTAVGAGVNVNTLGRAFQLLRDQPLEQALKSAGIFMVGATVPSVSADAATIEATLRQSLASYPAILPQTGIAPFIGKLVDAGMTPSQASTYLVRAFTSGKAAAAPYVSNVPPSAIPALPIDIDVLVLATQQRLGATFTPAHEAWVRQHIHAAFDKTIGLQHFNGQTARTICQYLANATGLPLPAGL